jgi:predicted branched-subunit amino acid permease
MNSILQQFREWTGLAAGNVEMLCYVFIGLAFGLFLRGKGSNILFSLLLGLIGAIS